MSLLCPLLPETPHPRAGSVASRGASQPATCRKGAPRAHLEMDKTPEAQVLGALLSFLPLLPTGTRLYPHVPVCMSHIHFFPTAIIE